MPLKPLTPNPDLDHFRHQARDLRKAHLRRDPEALQRIREFHPRLFRASDATIGESPFTLSDAKLTVAREYGFPGWPRLKAFVTEGKPVDPATPFQERVTDPLFRRAVDLIDGGDEEGLRDWLAEHSQLVRQRAYFSTGFYFGNPTLLQFIAENPIRHGRLPVNIVAIARILLDAGANANDGTLGLVASGRVVREQGQQIPLIDLLCACGADPNAPMQGALAHGEFAAAQALMERGARRTLKVAAALGETEDALRLLPEADKKERHLALALAAQHGRLEIVRLLLDAGEDPSCYNPLEAHAHSTPLHQAVCYAHADVVKLLVQRGARLDLKDTIFHGTPLGWAEYAGHIEIAAYLRGSALNL